MPISPALSESSSPRSTRHGRSSTCSRIATAPTLTANFSAGDYTVYAHSDYGTVALYLTNTASGLPASITATGGSGQDAAVNGQYAQPLQARVTDVNGNPVQGVTVSFSVAPGGTGSGL